MYLHQSIVFFPFVYKIFPYLKNELPASKRDGGAEMFML